MIQATNGAPGSSVVNQFIFIPGQSPGAPTFAAQLATAIQGALQVSGNGSQLEINVQPGTGSQSNQYAITVTDGPPAASSTASSTASTATSSPSTPAALPITAPAPSAATPMSSSAAPVVSQTDSAATLTAGSTAFSATGISLSTAPPTLAEMTPADAYWAEQPAAVQALRYMPMDERTGAAEQLAAEGYTIDVPIMVDGGDPLAVMIQREIDGYTWVPSATQANIPAGPGMMVPGTTPYDPNSAPAGSIIVSTAFALGTNMQDPVVSAQDMQNFVLNQSAASSTV